MSSFEQFNTIKSGPVYIIFLYGKPASGKYTIAREIVKSSGYYLYHNHEVVDKVLKEYSFGTPQFIAERDKTWREYFSNLDKGNKGNKNHNNIVFTFNPENTVPQEFIDWLFNDLNKLLSTGVVIYSINIKAKENSIISRINNESRKTYKKLADEILYKELDEAKTFDNPTIPRTDLIIDTDILTPKEAATAIIKHCQKV